MKILFLKPKDKKLIRDPLTGQHLPPEGAAVQAGPFWHTALRVCDVVATTESAIAKAKETNIATKSKD